jgi:hypothetical protein
MTEPYLLNMPHVCNVWVSEMVIPYNQVNIYRPEVKRKVGNMSVFYYRYKHFKCDTNRLSTLEVYTI